MSQPYLIWLPLACSFSLGCQSTASVPPQPTAAIQPEIAPTACALIVTDDDIPSGSPTAGAMYVEDAKLGRALLTKDVAAVVKGFQHAGLDCIWVADGHDEALDHTALEAIGAKVLTTRSAAWKWPFFGIVPRAPAVAALVGFHAPAKHPTGFRPHTINDGVGSLQLDGKPAGEVAHLTLGLAGVGIPVVLVSGDAAAAEEARTWAPAAERVTVRWRDPSGAVRFLTADQGAQQLSAAASRAGRQPRPPIPEYPSVRVRLEMNNKLAADAGGAEALKAWAAQMAEEPDLAQLLRDYRWGDTLRIRDGVALWSTPDATSAFFTIAFAASFLRGANTWEEVSEGYAAYKAKDYDKAEAAYVRALERNPYDVATKCRLGAVHLASGEHDEARDLFAFGVAHLDDVGEGPMQSWCTIGLAQCEEALGHRQAAMDAARRTLALPDTDGRHEAARKILAEN